MSCFTFLKVMMVLFNLVIVIAGGVLLGVGIWIKVDSKSFISIIGSLFSEILPIMNVSYVIIALGVILFVLGFLGCCGAQKESKCLLITFFSLVLIICIIEIAAAVVALVFTPLAENFLRGPVIQSLEKDYGVKNDTTAVWNDMMSEFKCCGLSNYTDFDGTHYFKNHDFYPKYCCGGNHNCTVTLANETATQGCFQGLLNEIHSKGGIVGGVAAGICALEIAAMVVAMYLYCRLDEK